MSRSTRFALAALLAGASAALLPSQAWAFCRTMACSTENPAFACMRDSNGCLNNDRPLYWPTSCLSFGVHEDGSSRRGIDFDATHQVVVDSFNTWLNADCGGGLRPTVQVKDFGKVECGVREYNSNQGNANVFMYRDERWPYENAEDTLALTTITFNTETAQIYDADVEINSFDSNITVSNTAPDADLASILTHEVGHFFGLSHSNDPAATMRPGYRPGNTDLRTLASDDVAGICAIYAPDRVVPRAECEPRHGFSRECAVADDGGCTVNGVTSSPTRSSALFAFAAVGIAGLRRFGRRRSRG